MSLIIKVPGVAFTRTLPKLYRDAVIGTGTKFVHDALNAASYAKQAAPAAGNPSADLWTNLVDGAGTGKFYSPSGEIVWGGSGGFASVGGPSEKIAALNNANPAAESKCVGIVWVKHGSGGGTTDCVANFGDMLTVQHTNAINGAVPANRFYATSSSVGGITEFTGIGDTTAKVGTVFQLAVAYDSVALAMAMFVNGVQVASRVGYQALPAPTRPHTLAQATGFGAGYVGTFYRWLFDNLTGGKTAAEVVALDYALNAGRFA